MSGFDEDEIAALRWFTPREVQILRAEKALHTGWELEALYAVTNLVNHCRLVIPEARIRASSPVLVPSTSGLRGQRGGLLFQLPVGEPRGGSLGSPFFPTEPFLYDTESGDEYYEESDVDHKEFLEWLARRLQELEGQIAELKAKESSS